MISPPFEPSAQSGSHTPALLHDRYQPLHLLGKKSGRQTWLSQDMQTQQPVVVKLLTFNHDFEWDDLKLFEREAETLRSLSHPAIPRYLDYFELDAATGKGFGLVQTYIEARSLQQHLQAGRTFTEAEVKQIAQNLLEILGYLHDRQPPVIHRDIKPSNVLLTNRSGNSPGQAYLVDFGSVQTLAAKEGGTITVVGTYGYMPPEQFGGRAVPASDLYSLGATLIYLATGQHPADLPQVDLKLKFEAIANLSPSFTRWLQRLVEPSLSQRFPSTQAALQGLNSPQAIETRSAGQPLVRIEKPFDTKVKLRKTPDQLEILLPARGFKLGVVGWWTFAMLWNWLVAATLPYTAQSAGTLILTTMWDLSTGYLSGALMNALGVGVILGFWGVGIVSAKRALLGLFGGIRVRCDRKTITLSHHLFGLPYRSIHCRSTRFAN